MTACLDPRRQAITGGKPNASTRATSEVSSTTNPARNAVRGRGNSEGNSDGDGAVLARLGSHTSGPHPRSRELRPDCELGWLPGWQTIGGGSATPRYLENLSGGNQQKVVLGKWLLRSPSVFILDEPTRGIDVGAKYEVYKIMNQMVLDGAGVLFISSEMEELIGMCDRIMVMNRGEISAIHDRASFNSEKILESALWGGLDVER